MNSKSDGLSTIWYFYLKQIIHLPSFMRVSAGSCSREELPYVRGQGQKPGGPHAWRAAAKRSYLTSEVRGSGRECQAAMVQEWPRRATPHLRSGVVAERSYPMPKARGRGQEDQLQARGQGRWTGGPTPCPRSGGCTVAGGTREAIPRWRSGRVAVRRYPLYKVRSSGCALLEQPWRDTTPKVRETQVRW